MNRKPLHSHVLAAKRYADAVVSGEIDACRFVKAACARHLNDLERQRDAAFPYRFDPVAGEKVCKFAELLPHIKGEWAGKLIRLEPWQSFILSTLFGWVRKSDGKRRFRELYAEIPRKNGKSVFGAVIGLYMFTADGEAGAEVYSGATTEKQAWEVFRPAKLMATRADGFSGHFGVQVNASNMAIVDQAAKFEPIIGNPGDGASPHCAIIDEYHEHRTPDQYDTMITGMGARLQPLTVIITTAGTNLSGPCYDKRATVVKLLDGVIENEELFAIIYTLDDDDDWTDFALWKKANPNYGVSVYEDYLRARHREAIQQASRQNIIQCKHLNRWMNADTAWMNMVAWRKCQDAAIREEDYREWDCVIGLDLASKTDLASMVKLFSRVNDDGNREYAAFATHYLNEDTAESPSNSHYAGWVKEGWMTATPGNVTDYAYIEDDILDAAKNYNVVEVAFDPFQATYITTRLAEQGVNMVEYGSTVRNMSEPMKEVEAAVLSGRLKHNGDPVFTWAMSNVVAHYDRKDNIFPNKERPENKIDPVVALIMATGRAMVAKQETSVGLEVW